MSPEMGRFISSDTIGVWGDAGNLGNGYAYVGNSPHDWTDPSGMKKWWDPTAIYGNWCGWTASGPDAPIDELDLACRDHDYCIGTANLFDRTLQNALCHTLLLVEASEANCKKGLRLFKAGHCRAAKQAIMYTFSAMAHDQWTSFNQYQSQRDQCADAVVFSYWYHDRDLWQKIANDHKADVEKTCGAL